MNNIKQLRIRIIDGVNTHEGERIYSEGFNLTDLIEVEYLKRFCKSCIIDGFIIETSTFEKGKHQGGYGENEFQPFLEYIHAVKDNKDFIFHGEIFPIMPYHIISNSVLDVNNDISLIFAIINPNDIQGTIESISETFELNSHVKSKKMTYSA